MSRPIDLAAALALVAVGAACSQSEPIGVGSGCVGAFIAGDLVVSEIFANPAGTDDGKEWFEIYNASSGAASLGGVQLVTAKNDGTGERKHRMRATTLAAGGYLVVGGVEDGALPAGVDYGYGDDLGDLRNTAGRIQLLCGTTIVDSTDYATAPEEQSRSFTGAQTPDAVANDDDARWCAVAPTPRAANPSCTPVNQSMCLDGAAMRAVVAPEEGDLEIVEWMPNPTKVLDTAGEWFEVRVDRDVDLNGLTIASTSEDETLEDASCLRFTAGDRVLFARGDMAGMNGGLPAVDFTFGFDLRNTGGDSIFLRLGAATLDEITYTTFTDGAATQIDDQGTLCDATATYGAGDKGTPGAANPLCGGSAGNTCLDGGTPRVIVAAAPGDLVISEIMPNPASAEPAGEWFEVYVARNVDLNGVQVGPTLVDLTTITEADCIAVTAGSFLIFARNTTMGANGGLPRVDRPITFNLVNDAGSIVLAFDDALLDAVTWTTTTNGVSASVSADKLDPDGNDMTSSFCPGVGTYGAGGMGTPGAANPTCP